MWYEHCSGVGNTKRPEDCKSTFCKVTPCKVTFWVPTASPTRFSEKSQDSLCWKGPVKVLQADIPAASKDIFNQTRLHTSSVSLTLNVAKNGTSTNSLGIDYCVLVTVTFAFFSNLESSGNVLNKSVWAQNTLWQKASFHFPHYLARPSEGVGSARL